MTTKGSLPHIISSWPPDEMLIVALLAAVPLRKRAFAALSRGSFRGGEAPRSRLLHRGGHPIVGKKLEHPFSLWPMCGGAIYDAVRRCTLMRLSLAVNLHRFRGAAGTLWSISDPVNVLGTKDLLGHTDFKTTERHYLAARSRMAGRALAQVLRSQRRRRTPD